MHLKIGTIIIDLRNVWLVARRVFLWVNRMLAVAMFGGAAGWLFFWLGHHNGKW